MRKLIKYLKGWLDLATRRGISNTHSYKNPIFKFKFPISKLFAKKQKLNILLSLNNYINRNVNKSLHLFKE